jgi:MinD-like ATPase involved in chromosome partitioning or flagellar assembly
VLEPWKVLTLINLSSWAILKKNVKVEKPTFMLIGKLRGEKKLSKIVAVHSYKGGTGKTLMSVNLAATFAKHGKKVCLFDLDFRAPSLFAILKVENTEFWLNDYLNGKCEITKTLIDLSSRLGGRDNFYASLANPTTEAIREMSAKDRKWEMRALGRLLSLRNVLLNDQHFDYLVFDTSPGLQYSSINAIVTADFVVVATTGDRSDVDGTRRMLRELYNLFEKKTGLVMNKVLDPTSKSRLDELSVKVKDVYQVPMLGLVPCFCEVLRAEGNLIFVQDRSSHPFTKILDEMARKIENNQVN